MTALSRFRAQLRVSSRVLRAVVGNPALRRVELAFLLFSCVVFGTWIAILLYAYAAIGPTSVGLVALVQLLPAAVVAPMTANLADRFPRDGVLFAGYLVQVVTFGSTGIGMALNAPPALVVLAAVCALMSLTVTRPTQSALTPSLARTPEELTASNALSGTVEGVGMLLGPLSAAAILAVAAPAAVFGAAALACLVAAALVARLPRSATSVGTGPTPEVFKTTDLDGLLDGIRFVARDRDTRLVVGILSLKMVVSGALDVFFVLLALEVFDVGPSGAGLMNAALGVGVIIGGATTFTLVGQRSLAPILGVATVASGLAVIVLAAVSPAWSAPIIAVTGIGFAASDVVGRTILQRVAPDEVMARVFGALEGLSMASLALGAVLAPVIVLIVGIQGAIVVAGLLMPVGFALSWLGLRAMDRNIIVPRRALDLLRAVEIFMPLPPPQLETVARHARWITFEPGQAVITEGDPGDAYYILESGALRVTKGSAVLRDLRGRGDAVGEIALLRDVPRTATVTATEVSIMLMLERAAFLQAVTGHAQAGEAARRVVEARP